MKINIKKIIFTILMLITITFNIYSVKAWGGATDESTWIQTQKTNYTSRGYALVATYSIQKGETKTYYLYNDHSWGYISNLQSTDSNIAGASGKSDGFFGLGGNSRVEIKGFELGRAVITFKADGNRYFILVIVKDAQPGTTETPSSTVDVIDNTEYYKPGDIDDSSARKIESKTSKILTVISNIGIAVSVIVLAILGVKYMFGSVEDKAEYKQDMIPYLIGALLLFGITGFLKILIAIGETIGTT